MNKVAVITCGTSSLGLQIINDLMNRGYTVDMLLIVDLVLTFDLNVDRCINQILLVVKTYLIIYRIYLL